MIAEEATKSIEQAVLHELRNIVKKYGTVYHSEHEGFAVLMEEVQEASDDLTAINDNLALIWKRIKDNENFTAPLGELKDFALALAEEAVQIAAVSERFLETVK